MRKIEGGLDEVRAAWQALRQELGRPPTTGEMSRKLGKNPDWCMRRMTLLGLERHWVTRKEFSKQAEAAQQKRRRALRKAIAAGRQEPQVSTQTTDLESGHIRKMKIHQIWLQKGTGPKDQRVGSEYKPGDLARVKCACCGRPMVIRPREWMYWVRRKDGTIAYLCRSCDGVSLPGAYKGTSGER